MRLRLSIAGCIVKSAWPFMQPPPDSIKRPSTGICPSRLLMLRAAPWASLAMSTSTRRRESSQVALLLKTYFNVQRGWPPRIESLRASFEIQKVRRRRAKKVARRATSGQKPPSFRALAERQNPLPRFQRGDGWAASSRGFTSGYPLQAASRLQAIPKHALMIDLLPCPSA